MANKTFKDFNLITTPVSGDYLIGYNANGTAEYRITMANFVGYLNNFFVLKPTPLFSTHLWSDLIVWDDALMWID